MSFFVKLQGLVSNSPCGVERKIWPSCWAGAGGFLIHRVELKVFFFILNIVTFVPCF